MKLIGSLTSPYVRKVRIVMAEHRVQYQFEQEDVWNRDTIMQFNPLGKVPCLVLDSGEVLFDSRVIADFIDTQSAQHLIPASGLQRAIVQTWEALADGVLDAALLARMEQTWAARSDGQRSQAWIDRQVHKITTSLAAMSQRLGDAQWCDGRQFTLADIATGCALSYLDFRFSHIDWRGSHANLARLQARLAQSKSFMDTAPP
jgi:glutathione S-transferase